LPDSTSKNYSRKKYFKCLLKSRLNSAPSVRPGKAPTAVLTVGGPATGKSTIVNERINQKDFVVVDPDDLKASIPEYNLAVNRNAKNAAAMAHDESSALADSLVEAAVAARKNVIIDGTGKNLDKYVNSINAFKQAGYSVIVMGTHVDLPTALDRVEKRADCTGRWVPSDVVKEISKKVPCNIKKISEAADEFVLFTTMTDKPREVISKHVGGPVKVLDKDYVSSMTSHCPAESRPLGTVKQRQGMFPLRGAPSVPLAEVLRRVKSGKPLGKTSSSKKSKRRR
jgi:predicted ABC-type ATPase